MTEQPKKLLSPFSVEITNPTGVATVVHTGFPVNGDYGGTSDPGVMIDVKLTYVNPTGNNFSTGKLVPEDPANQAYSRLFSNVDPTAEPQRGLLTAFLYDPSGNILLAQSTTIEVIIV